MAVTDETNCRQNLSSSELRPSDGDDQEEEELGDEVEPEDQERTAWAEGYTPLEDLTGAALMSIGPDSRGAVFASNPDDAYSAGWSESDWETEDTYQMSYNNIADRALSSLEQDYQETMQQNAPHQEAESQSHSIESLFELPPITLASPGEFDASFDAIPSVPSRLLPNIDIGAIQRAVAKISLQKPQLQSNLSAWEKTQTQRSTRVPRSHALIPALPLAAFYKRTPKAKLATTRLSRSASIAEALVRLDMLQSQETFVIHLVGCDATETATVDQITKTFGPLIRWMGVAAEGPQQIELHLVGPNVLVMPVPTKVDLMPAVALKRPQLKQAHAICHACVYHDWKEWNTPDVVVAFDVGVWGYDDWCPTLQFMLQKEQSIPFIVTSYTLQEAEDDFDAIEKEVISSLGSHAAKSACLWDVEGNLFGSKVIRDTATAISGREYRENSAWQAWRL